VTSRDTSLIGRGEELSRLSELVAPPHVESRVLLILGDPGMGKSVLLAEAAREARLAGMRVLAAAGRESEEDLAFAGLHQLLRPVLDRVADLPARQAGALRGAFALSEDPVPPDALLTGIAVLTLLSGLSDDAPLLVAADDAQWLDRASLDALAFAARRLESERLVLLAGARGNVPPAGFERDFPQLLLPPGPTARSTWCWPHRGQSAGLARICWQQAPQTGPIGHHAITGRAWPHDRHSCAGQVRQIMHVEQGVGHGAPPVLLRPPAQFRVAQHGRQ